MPAQATIDDFRALCERAAERGLAVELAVSDTLTGPEGSKRRTLHRLRLVARARQDAHEIAGSAIVGDEPFSAARRLLTAIPGKP